MGTAVRAVHPALRRHLAGPLVAYDLSLPTAAVHVGIPSTAATMIFAVDEPLDVGWLAQPKQSSTYWGSISGLHLHPALIHTHGLQRGIHVALTPAGCRALFGMPIAALAGTTADLADLPRGIAPGEQALVASRGTWHARLAAVEALLLRQLLPEQQPPPDVVEAWRMLAAGARVAHVADELGWSRRHLTNRVRAEFGIGPKEVGRLARFERAHRMLLSGLPQAQVAHRSGFSDQSHMSREWRAFTGLTPAGTREEFPNLQDLLAASPAH